MGIIFKGLEKYINKFIQCIYIGRDKNEISRNENTKQKCRNKN